MSDTLSAVSRPASCLAFAALLAHALFRWPTTTSDFVLLGVFIMSSTINAALSEMLHRLYFVAQKTAADAAREQELRTSVMQAPVAIAMFDSDMKYMAVSKLWLDMFPRSVTDVVGHSHYKLFPHLSPHWIEAHRRGLAGETVGKELDHFSSPDLGDRWYRWEVRPWWRSKGDVGGITIFVENVTERITRETELKTREARLRAFFENIGVGAILLGPDGRFCEVSDSFCRMTGYTRDELLTSVTTSELTHEDDQTTDQELLAKYLAGETPHYSTEKRYRRKDRSILWVRASAHPIRDEDGRIIQSAGIIEDITERKRAEAHKNLLLAEMNHRAKNLLTVVQSIAELTSLDTT